MKHLIRLFLLVPVLSLGCLTAVAAETAIVDDVTLLAQKGLGEEVLLAYVDRADSDLTLTTDQIVKLKQAGVPEKVIAAMLRKRSAPTREAESRIIVRAQQPVYEYTAPRTRVVRQVERVAEDEDLTNVVYRPAYASSYPTYYYPSSSYYPYYSSYYPSNYYWGYSSPFSFSLWGGWQSSCRSWGYGGHYGHGGSHHSSGHHR